MMCRIYHLFLPLFSLFLVRVDLTDIAPMRLLVKELRILDGDTVLVKRGGASYRVRLLYIDAPEMGQVVGEIDLGEYSKRCLEQMIKLPVTLRIHGHDRYRRMLGVLGDTSLRMIENGCAYLYDYSKFESRAEKIRYLTLQNKAQRLRVGLWKFKVLNPRLHRKKNYKF